MIEVRGLSFQYGDQPVLEKINLRFLGGMISAILGPNGAGKSTLLKIISGSLSVRENVVWIQQKDINTFTKSELARMIAYVPQTFNIDTRFTVREIVSMGRYPYRGTTGKKMSDSEAVNWALEMVEADTLSSRKFFELSGGERQRVILASALAQEPEILLLDEPGANLDIYHQTLLYEILSRLASEQGMAIVTVTHQVNIALQYSKNVIVLKRGKVVFAGNPEQLIEAPVISHVFNVEGEFVTAGDAQRKYFIPLKIFQGKKDEKR